MSELSSTDPRTGAETRTGITATSPTEVDTAVTRAAAAAVPLAEADRDARATLLRAMAEELASRRTEIVSTADAETGLGSARLNGELTRTCYQLQVFAEVVADGGYLEATVDHAADTPMGPRPDLRRMLVPLGPVAVFGASNFPLAFSVPGGDTASALAAGCPVVVKAHESHPRTSQLCGTALAAAVTRCEFPEGTVSVVYGREAGARLVQHPDITAVGFTGSRAGGQALLDLVNQGPDPIPFYGELSGVNPLVVTEAAAEHRARDIGSGLAGSYTLGSGQFCTKPGLAFVPDTPAGTRLVDAVAEATRAADTQVLLNAPISAGFAAQSTALAQLPGVHEVARGMPATEPGHHGQATVLSVPVNHLDARLTEECFGPLVVLVRYSSTSEVISALERLEASLTATVHMAEGEEQQQGALLAALRRRSGRLVFNGYPTGVAVSWAQHHGGPWPATNAIHTSVGPTAIRRFLRPYTWQDAPTEALPPELRDESPGIPRRVDGELMLPARNVG